MGTQTPRLVYYGLSTRDEGSQVTVGQLLRSVASLRAHNRTIPIRLYLFGALDPKAHAELSALGVSILSMGDYEVYLRRFCPPSASEALARYPIMQNIACLPELADSSASQILYLDADTHFFRDVEALFDSAGDFDLIAREIPGSVHHRSGVSHSLLDRQAYEALAMRVGARVIAPFNTGVLLFNRGSWRALAPRVGDILGDAHRFAVWTALHRRKAGTTDVRYLREHRKRLISAEDERTALPYPSQNPWIRDEIATALNAGKVPGLRVGTFSRHDVLQGDEYRTTGFPSHIVAHYFTVNTSGFAAWLAEQENVSRARREVVHGGSDAGAVFAFLGEAIDAAWKKADRDEDAFPGIAAGLLREARLPERLSAADVVKWSLFAARLSEQEDIEAMFGQPPVTVFQASRFQIQVLFWLEGSTAIHRHGFSGAFQLLDGTSLHAEYSFEVERRINEGLSIGRANLKRSELLARGDIREIRQDLIHSLFHLDTPSATVVVRTHHEKTAQPQYDVAPPSVLHDPEYADRDTIRKAQLLDFARRSGLSIGKEVARELFRGADLWTCWELLRRAAQAKTSSDYVLDLLDTAHRVHESAFDELASAVREDVRRRLLRKLRARVTDRDQRFFLALLASLPDRESIYAAVIRRYPGSTPQKRVMGWLMALSGVDKIGIDLKIELNRHIVLALLGGSSDEEVCARLEDSFNPKEVRAKRAAIVEHCARIRATSLAPLFV